MDGSLYSRPGDELIPKRSQGSYWPAALFVVLIVVFTCALLLLDNAGVHIAVEMSPAATGP